jgi:hypothetical protein
VYDFARRIAAGEKFPSRAFGIEPFDPAILVGHLPMPERAKRAIHRAVHSVGLSFIVVSHDAIYPSLVAYSSKPANVFAPPCWLSRQEAIHCTRIVSMNFKSLAGGSTGSIQMMDAHAEVQSNYENCAGDDGQKQPDRHGDLPIRTDPLENSHPIALGL